MLPVVLSVTQAEILQWEDCTNKSPQRPSKGDSNCQVKDDVVFNLANRILIGYRLSREELLVFKLTNRILLE